MDKAYLNWILLLGAGMIVGLFVSTRTVLICAVAASGIAVVGLVLGGVQKNESLAMLSRVALMMIPVCGGLVMLGAGLTDEARKIMAKRKKKQASDEASRKT